MEILPQLSCIVDLLKEVDTPSLTGGGGHKDADLSQASCCADRPVCVPCWSEEEDERRRVCESSAGRVYCFRVSCLNKGLIPGDYQWMMANNAGHNKAINRICGIRFRGQ